jgi:hypothetical protein
MSEIEKIIGQEAYLLAVCWGKDAKLKANVLGADVFEVEFYSLAFFMQEKLYLVVNAENAQKA